MVDVYHEFSFPVEMINSIKNALKPNGELFLIEYRAEDLKVPIKRIHKMTEEQAVKEMKAAGLVLKENIDYRQVASQVRFNMDHPKRMLLLQYLYGISNADGEVHPHELDIIRLIAKYLGIEGSGAYVRVSQLKKQAIDKLIASVDHSQLADLV